MRHVVFALFAIASVSIAQSPRLPQLRPVDAATEDESLRTVRDAALAAAKAKDVPALMSLVSTLVVIGDGGDAPGGLKPWLAETLSNREHEWWRGLEDALSHGGAFTTTRGAMEGQREFCAPYFYATFPEQVPEAARGEGTPWVVIDKDVAVHAAPDAKSRVLARWSYVLVQATGADRRDRMNPDVLWKSVDFPENSESFVLASKMRNPEGFHVCLAKEWGRWRISLIRQHRGL
jgi:hypothetical protein